MAAIITKYAPGNMNRMVRASFSARTLAGVGPGLVGGMGANEKRGITRGILDAVTNFAQSRWGQQRGSITQLPDGTIVQKQAAGVPVFTSPPFQAGFYGPEGFATGWAGSTTMLVIVAGMAVVLLSRKR